MLTSELIRAKAREWGADIVGIGDIRGFDGEIPQRDPRYILPRAKSIIGVVFRIPRANFEVGENGGQYYSLTEFGIKYTAEEQMIYYMHKMMHLIEDAGYEAVPQRDLPNLRIKDDPGVNPEVRFTTVMQHARSVMPDRPAPDVMIDFDRAARICGLGSRGLSGHLLNDRFGPYQRMTFIVTNAPLEYDTPVTDSLCDQCGACEKACPGHAISMKEGLNEWQCAVYYRGAHKSNPFMTEDFLRDHPDREAILNGEMRFHKENAKELVEKIQFLPDTQYRYVACLCGRKCDIACYRHLQENGLISSRKEGE